MALHKFHHFGDVAEANRQYFGPIDIAETATQFVFRADVPGMTRADVNVTVTDGNTLTMTGERNTTNEDGDGTTYHRVERNYGRFSRHFRLPDGVDAGKVSATCDHGVLSVIVPKKNATPEGRVQSVAVFSDDTEGDGSINKEFENIPISIFPTPALGKLVSLNSDMKVCDAVKVLSEYKILAAPVRDVSKPDDEPWSTKYLGMFDMSTLVVALLDKLQPDGTDPASFFEALSRTDAFKNCTVGSCAQWAQFGPFVPVDTANGNLLDCMLLCGKHNIRRVPVVVSPGGDMVNIITQSALVQTLSANLTRPGFDKVAAQTLRQVGLGDTRKVYAVRNTQKLRDAFALIKEKDVSGVAVVDDAGRLVGNISARDSRLIATSAKVYKLLNMPISVYLDVVSEGALNSAIYCEADCTLGECITRMVSSRIHRIFVVDGDGKPTRVVSLRNVLMKFCKEPAGYFGKFFN